MTPISYLSDDLLFPLIQRLHDCFFHTVELLPYTYPWLLFRNCLTSPCFSSLQCFHRLTEFLHFLSKCVCNTMIMRRTGTTLSILLSCSLSPVLLRIRYRSRNRGCASTASTPTDSPYPCFSVAFTVAFATVVFLLFVTWLTLCKFCLMGMG